MTMTILITLAITLFSFVKSVDQKPLNDSTIDSWFHHFVEAEAAVPETTGIETADELSGIAFFEVSLREGVLGEGILVCVRARAWIFSANTSITK